MAKSLPKVCPFLVTVDLKLKWPELPVARIMRLSMICPTSPSTGQVGDLTSWEINSPTSGAYSEVNSPYFPPQNPHSKSGVVSQNLYLLLASSFTLTVIILERLLYMYMYNSHTAVMVQKQSSQENIDV